MSERSWVTFPKELRANSKLKKKVLFAAACDSREVQPSKIGKIQIVGLLPEELAKLVPLFAIYLREYKPEDALAIAMDKKEPKQCRKVKHA